MFKYLLITLCLLGGIANAGTIDGTKSDKQYLDYGAKHECVVQLYGIYHRDDKDVIFNASAVVFKPSWILTAAHIVQEAKDCAIVLNDKKIPISHVAFHKSYHENVFAKYDIAIGRLETPTNLDFYPELYSKDDEVGKVCSISGFGVTGPYQIATNKRQSDGKKRAGTNTIAGIQNHLLICNLKDTKTALEFLICHGDSGGGLFIDKKLAGINSCIFTDDKVLDANISDESGHTRVSLFIDWINMAMEEIEKKAAK